MDRVKIITTNATFVNGISPALAAEHLRIIRRHYGYQGYLKAMSEIRTRELARKGMVNANAA